MMKIRRYLSMYLTDEKTKHSSWVGSYQTRKWNDVTSIIYYDEMRVGKSKDEVDISMQSKPVD